MDQPSMRPDSGFQSVDHNCLSSENNQIITYNKTEELPNFDALLLRDYQIQTLDNDIQQMTHLQYETQKDICDLKQQFYKVNRCVNGMQKTLQMLMETYFMDKIFPNYESKSGKIPVEAESSFKIVTEDEIESGGVLYSNQDKTDECKLQGTQAVECSSLIVPCFSSNPTKEYQVTTKVLKPPSIKYEFEEKENSSKNPVTDLSPKVPNSKALTNTENPNIVKYDESYHVTPCSNNESACTTDREQKDFYSRDDCIPLGSFDIKPKGNKQKIKRKSVSKSHPLFKDASCDTDKPQRDNTISDIKVKNRSMMDRIDMQDTRGSSVINNKGNPNFVLLKRKSKVVEEERISQQTLLEKVHFKKYTKSHEGLYKYRKKKMSNGKRLFVDKAQYQQKSSKKAHSAKNRTQEIREFVSRKTKPKNLKEMPLTPLNNEKHGKCTAKHLRALSTNKRRKRRNRNRLIDTKANQNKSSLGRPSRNGGRRGGIATNICFSYGSKELFLLTVTFLAITSVAVASDKNKKTDEKHFSGHYENGFMIHIQIGFPEKFIIGSDTIVKLWMLNINDITNALYHVVVNCSIVTMTTVMANVAVFWVINKMKDSHCDVTILHRGEILQRCFLHNDMKIKELIRQIEIKQNVKGNFYMKTNNIPILYPDWSMVLIASKEDDRSFDLHILDTDGTS